MFTDIVGFTQYMSIDEARALNLLNEKISITKPLIEKHQGSYVKNIGDGTYYHSGIMAIRAAVSSQINITYKILFNDAVAMTGGQGFDGPMTVVSVAKQVLAEGVKLVSVVSDEPEILFENLLMQNRRNFFLVIKQKNINILFYLF